MKLNLMNRFLNTVWLLFLLNLCLIVSNPLIVAAFFVAQSSVKLLFLGIGLLFFSPALNAVLFILNNSIEEKILSVFFTRYLLEFKSSILLGAPTIMMIGVLVADLFAMKASGKFQSLSIFFLILIVLGGLLYFYQFLFFSNFKMTIKASVKFALYLFFNKLPINAGIIAIQFIALLVAQRYLGYFVLIGFSGTLFLMNWLVKEKINRMKQTVNLHEGGMTFEHF